MTDASLSDMKLVYRVLHQHIAEHTELINSELLSTLQSALQNQAKADGVDVTDHAAWDAWLGHQNARPCDERVLQRQRLGN